MTQGITDTLEDEGSGCLPPRPEGAVGPYLRVFSICDTYTMENYPRMRTMLRQAQAAATGDAHGCVVICTHSGDFLSPNPLTGVDMGMPRPQSLHPCTQ